MRNPIAGLLGKLLVRFRLAVWRADPDFRYDIAAVLDDLRKDLDSTRLFLGDCDVPELPGLVAALPSSCVCKQLSGDAVLAHFLDAQTERGIALNTHWSKLQDLSTGRASMGGLSFVVLHGTFGELNADPEAGFRIVGQLLDAGMEQVRILGGTREGIWQPVLGHERLAVIVHR